MSKKRLKLLAIKYMPQKNSTKKTTTRKKTTRKTKKGKVYIPVYKIIILCVAIITICMALLLVTTLATPKQTSITERYETENKTEQIKETPKPEKPKVEQKKEEPVVIKTPEIKKQESQTEVKQKTQKTDNQPKVTENKPEPKVENKTPPKKEKTEAPAKPSYNFPKAKNGAQLIFVFDDGGQNNAQLEKYLTLPFPITVAVLPKLKNSASAAQKVRASGNEVILHQPMQAINASVNPGPGAIKPEMSDEEIKSVLFQNINEIGPIAGMNNHEGSAITADAEKMAVILQMASEEGIYFLDSRTNVDTKVPYVAGEMGYSYFERNIFLDNEKTKDNALKELKKGLDIANKNGNVIMIGHVWSADFLPAFLNEVYPELKEKGYTFSVVSKSKARK